MPKGVYPRKKRATAKRKSTAKKRTTRKPAARKPRAAKPKTQADMGEPFYLWIDPNSDPQVFGDLSELNEAIADDVVYFGENRFDGAELYRFDGSNKVAFRIDLLPKLELTGE